MKVLKFGGSSVANGAQFKKVKAIVESDPCRRYVVVSAPGKGFKGDNKVTDLLYLCHAHIKYSVNADSIFNMVQERFLSIERELNLKTGIESELHQLKRELYQGTMAIDDLVSRGEYFTAKLMAAFLGYTFIDAKDLIKFSYDGKLDMEKTKEAFRLLTTGDDHFVIPGFYGALPNGSVRIMERGGSDITGAIVASVVQGDVYENWTDVSGILMADPSIIQNPKQIYRITYDELRELSYMGANVLHEETVFPVKESRIPINIRNTNDPENPGTFIDEEFAEEKGKEQIITGLSGKKNFAVITAYKRPSANKGKTLQKALGILGQYKIKVEHVMTGIDNFMVVVPEQEFKHKSYEIATQLEKECDLISIRLSEGISLIAVVGRHMAWRPGISGKIFSLLGENSINIRVILQGAEEINIIFGVENRDFEKAISVIYHSFTEDDFKNR